jgi:hypothetical protein
MRTLNAAGARVSFAEITTDKGHDAFLLEEPELFQIVGGFLIPRRRARASPRASAERRNAVASERDLTMARSARGPAMRGSTICSSPR